jgi:hypothetical protein
MKKLILSVGRGVLIVALSGALSTSPEAQTTDPFQGWKFPSYKGEIVGAIVGVVAAVVIVTVVVKHKKRTITGCVNSGENGMSVTDDKDKRLYALSGDTAGIKLGDRMTLQVKKIKPKDAGKTLVWETKKIDKDFGVCQP